MQPGESTDEDGFDCHPSTPTAQAGAACAALEIGTPDQPIPAGHTALVRLAFAEGLDPLSCPAIVCCGGRMDLHGAPLAKTWVKLGRTNENSFEFDIGLAERVDDWKKGDRILLTGTRRPFPGHQYGYGRDAHERSQSETITIDDVHEENGRTVLTAYDYPPSNRHEGGPVFAGEAANLSRNVVIESADPTRARGHTMYHAASSGSISYVEFRHLGKEGVFGRYPIHFHYCGDSMRGSSVVGASIWDSGNRFVTIHATDYLVVRDCVGFRSVGHGFFLEDGTETYNVLDHNLACLALRGKPLTGQALVYDQNDGAGFWWANSRNVFTRNVAAECDQHGYRFEVVASAAFDPVLPVRQPDGTKKPVDIRTLPFIRFEDNEAHCMPRFGVNLGGYNGLSSLDLPDDDKLEDVGGVGPDKYHPFILRNTRLWDCDWAYHSGCPSVLNKRMTIYRVLYGIWRINARLQEHERLSMEDVVAGGFYYPRLDPHQTAGKDDEIEPKDDLPPFTVITRIARAADGHWQVRGVAGDDNEIRQVLVNGQSARSLRPNFAEWEASVDPSEGLSLIKSQATDTSRNVEITPHQVALPPR